MQYKVRLVKFDLFKVLVYLTVILISAFAVFGQWGTTLRNAFIFFSAIVGFFEVGYKRNFKLRFHKRSYFLFYIFFFLYCLVTLFWSGSTSSAINSIRHLAMAVILGFSLNCFLDRKGSNAEDLLNVFLIGVIIVSIYCLVRENVSLLSWARLGNNEFNTAGEGQTYYSCCLVIASFITIHKLFSSDRRVLFAVILSFIYACCIFTAVRKCLVIPLLFLLIYIIMRYHKNLLRAFFYVVIAVIVIFIIFFLVMRYSSSMSSRMMSLIAEFFSDDVVDSVYSNSMDSYSTRAWLRNTAMQLFLQHPIFGYGIGQFRVYSASLGGPYLYAHNNWLELLSCTGVIGFILYYAGSFFMVFRTINKMRTNTRNIDFCRCALIIASVFSLFVMDYGQVSYYYLMYVFIFSVLDNLSFNKFLNTI